MSKAESEDRSRRAFLTQAGGVLAALVAPTRVDGAQSPSRSESQPRDLGLWATWYDLPKAGDSEYLAWLHETYLPVLLKRPGYLWAAHYVSIPNGTAGGLQHTDDRAVPTGNAYILVVGAEDCNVFGKPAPDELDAALPGAGRKMLAMRIGERTNIFAEAARVTGPGAKEYKEMTLAPCIQLGSYNIDYRKEVEILAWYAQLQMPNMTVLPGSVRTRRLASVFGWAKMGILYEFTSVEMRHKFYGGDGSGSALAKDQRNKWASVVSELIHAPGSPNVARRIWPPVQT